MRFVKKPVEIEAVQFDGVPAHDPPGVFRRESDLSPYVVTIHEQRVYLWPGDWIIPEPDGVHYYPVKPDVFAQMYESADERSVTLLHAVRAVADAGFDCGEHDDDSLESYEAVLEVAHKATNHLCQLIGVLEPYPADGPVRWPA